MNQKERDKFPEIYKIMHEIKGRISDDNWYTLYDILNRLEPDWEGSKNMIENFAKRIMSAQDLALRDFFGIPSFELNFVDNTQKENYLVNYTKPLEKPLKRAFIVVLGALYTMYKGNLPYEAIDIAFEQWLEYKKNER